MENKQLKILYDATILVDGEFDNGCRSGIYFVALNILNELVKRKGLDVTLFTNPSRSAGLEYVIKTRFVNQKSVYRDTLLSRNMFSLLSFVREQRKKYFRQALIRKFFSLIELIIVYCYDILFCTRNLLCKKKKFDVFFSPFTAPPWYIRCQKKLKKYIVLYDTIPLKVNEYSSQKQSSWFGHLIRHLNSRDNYFAISHAAKKDFCQSFPSLDPQKIIVTHLAANERFAPIKSKEQIGAAKSKYKLPQNKRYIFSLCTLEPRKNLVRAVKTFVKFVEKNDINDLVFVLGGGSWKAFSEKIKSGLDNPDLFDKYVIKAGYVDDDDLPVLYSNAEWFVYTSQYEGFGLPPLEAMQCGCPVITSNNSSLPEVVGDAGIMIDWDSDEQHIAAYEKYYFNEELRNGNSHKGIERAKHFSWKLTTDKMMCIMKN